MARPPRLELPGVPLHVIQRGNNRTACFFGDLERRFYLKCLAEAAMRRGCAIHAYVLMQNHVHLLITPRESGAVAATLQDVGRQYVRIINSVHDRTGTLWEGRFKSSLIDTDVYLWTCHRYIELNPVRAGIVQHPTAYSWSSHAHYALGRTDRLITEHPVFLQLGKSETERRKIFQDLFPRELSETEMTRIRHAVNTGSALGSDSFLERIAATVGRSVRPPRLGRPPKARENISDSDAHTENLL